MSSNAPTRIETARLVLRAYTDADADTLHAAVIESREHLLPWMPFAQSQTMDDTRAHLERTKQGFVDGTSYQYGVFSTDERTLVGACGMVNRVGPSGTEIGYWMHVDHARQGFAREAAAALVRVGFDIYELDRIEIHCDVDNHRSAAVAQALGFTHEATLRRRLQRPDGTRRDQMIWTLFADDYKPDGSDVRALSATGERLL